MKSKTRRIVLVGMFAALVFVGTYINIPIYYPGGKTMIHLGTTAIFIGAIFLGKGAGLAGGIGSGLFDLLDPAYASISIFTFIIKGLTGLLAGAIAFSGGRKGNNHLINVVGFILGGAVSLGGYFILNLFLYGYGGAIMRLGSSLITTSIAIIITIPVSIVLRPLIKKSSINLLNDL